MVYLVSIAFFLFSMHSKFLTFVNIRFKGLTKTVALEVAQKNITVNAICPGYVKTPIVLNQIADTARVRGISEEDVITKVMLLNQATKKFAEIDEIVAAAMYLCSKQAASVTGTHISVDGGWCAQ
jgi:3-hydroxybutyrate dehydrogenase